jgi:hypothetical protein
MATSVTKNPPIINIVSNAHRCIFFLIEALFKDHGNANMNWVPGDLEKSNMLVFDKDSYDPTAITKKPKIIISRNPFAQQRVSMNDGNMSNPFKRATVTEGVGAGSSTNRKNFNSIVTGSSTFLCISENSLEAENIAFEVFSGLSAYRDALKTENFYKIEAPQIGATSKIKYQNERTPEFGVPVTMSYTLIHHYFIEMQRFATIADYININMKLITNTGTEVDV